VWDPALAAEVLAAVGATTALEEIEVLELPSGDRPGLQPAPGPNFRQMLGAIRANVGLRSLAFVGDDRGGVGCSEHADAASMKDVWTAVFANGTLERVNVRRVGPASRYDAGHRADCAIHVVQLLRSSRTVTHIQYHPETHDAGIMERQAVPILYLNRLRRMLLLLSSKPNEHNDDDDSDGDPKAAREMTTPDRLVPNAAAPVVGRPPAPDATVPPVADPRFGRI
jgi:hypothetical protein